MRGSLVALASIQLTGFSTLINRSALFTRSLISTPGHHPRIPGHQSQHECRNILRNPMVTNSIDRRISSQTELRSRFIRAPAVHTIGLHAPSFIPRPKPRNQGNEGQPGCTHTERAHTRSATETQHNSQPETPPPPPPPPPLLLLLCCCCCCCCAAA